MRLMDLFRFRRLARDRGGAMLVEFSLVLPGFFVVLLGGLAIADAMSAYNRVQNVSNTIGVMISRLKVVTNEDMVGMVSAARGYLFPFSSDGYQVLMAAVWVDDTGNATIEWCERWGLQKPSGETCSGSEVMGDDDLGYWVTGTNLTIEDLNIPSDILIPSAGLVVTQVTYEWDAPYLPLSAAQLTDFTMHDEFFYSPRADVTLTPPERDRDTNRPDSSYRVRG